MQSNTIAESLNTQYNISPVITGIILAIVTAIIIFGGVRSIATLSSLIVTDYGYHLHWYGFSNIAI